MRKRGKTLNKGLDAPHFRMIIIVHQQTGVQLINQKRVQIIHFVHDELKTIQTIQQFKIRIYQIQIHLIYVMETI
ncbi:unnamed protein product [Paramecium sonneborni]|uniref:Uncharacterized protein n=1 Tax=Paramecium sonneborni TaxID=65129 RepID=A0A8S1KY67_9CILI|nr:unnamed protein product [Paramecium sonneborni]